MKLHVLPFAFVFGVATSSAFKVSMKQIKRSSFEKRSGITNFATLAATSSSNDNDMDVSTVHDLIYMANVTVGGNVYPIQLDTGSSDLWIKGSTSPLPNATQTSTTYNITYGIGWAYGHVSYADVEFAGISVSSQALLDTSIAQNPALGYGADGIVGLGFTSLSTIDALVNSTGSSAGRSLLYNLFQDNPSEPNFIAFSLQRSTQADDDVEGSFAIGEYDPDYAAVANATQIPTWPVTAPKRWSVLLDAYMLGSDTITPTTGVPDVPSNRALVVLDTGTSWTYVPEDVCNSIYSNISGAKFSSDLGQWVLPCDAEIDMALQFNGLIFPLHPLDINIQSLSDSSTCVGSIIPQSFGSQFDWLIGDNVLRSMYSVYDFGDFDSNNQMGNPYLRLLSLTNPDDASAEFAKARGSTARTGITYNSSNGTAAAASSTSVDVSSQVAETLAKIGTYFPAILAIVALNALVLLAVVILGIVFLCRKSRKSKRQRGFDSSARTPMGRLTPMPMNTRDSEAHNPHSYEPVSMAITEDTMFVPPSPAFRKLDGSMLKPGDRPKSLATLPSQQYHQENSSEDALFGPPSPGFREFDATRPRSVGMMPSNPYHPLASENGSVDPPFTPPRSPRSILREGSVSTVASQPMQLHDPPLAPPRSPFRYEARVIDRPQSLAMISSQAAPPPMPKPEISGHPLEEDITHAPNPSFLRAKDGSVGDRPMSVA